MFERLYSRASKRPPGAVAIAANDPHYARRWLILIFVCVAQMMLLVDSTVVNVALPSAQRALHFSTANREWIITAYVLAFGSLLPLGGRMSDLWGRKLMFVIGALGFAGASAVGGAAQNFTMLVTARAVQGVFGALLAPAALAMISVTFVDIAERAKAFGVFGAVASSSAAVGLLLGGVLTSYVSWRWTMFVNIAFAVVALMGALTLMTNSADPQRPRLDILGTVLATAGLFGIVFGAAKAQTSGWGATITIASLAIGVGLLLLFVPSQRRASYPLVPLRVIGDRSRGAGLLTLFLSSIALLTIFLFLTYYFQVVQHYSPVKTGLAFLPLPVAMGTAATVVQTKLQGRVPLGALFGAGGLTAAAGAVLLTRVAVGSSYAGWALGGLVLIGLGTGTALIAAIAASNAGVAPEDAGAAGSLTNVSQQIGPAIGIAVLSTVAATATTHYAIGHQGMHNLIAHATVHGFVVSFWWAAAIFAAAAVIGGAMVRSAGQTETGTQTNAARLSRRAA